MKYIPTRRAVITSSIIGAVLLCLTGAWVFSTYLDTSHTIRLTDEGFTPQELTVQVGDTVTFVNERNQPFWPAVDLHPTHALYPDFDSKEPLVPGSEWSFTFDDAGVWPFHDHVAPLYEGTITVTDSTFGFGAPKFQFEDCTVYTDDNERITCWDMELKAEYEVGGVERGFEVFAHLFNTEPLFAEDCHTYTHTLGQLAYNDYRSGKDFDVTNQVAYCSYGFFHGFMEALVFETGDYSGARDFCDYIEKRLEGDISSIGPCIHGIGHGLTDGSDPRAYGDAHKMVEPGLKICKDVTRTQYEDRICATGIYNALGELFLKDPSSPLFDEDDMYEVCRAPQEVHIKEACYEDLKIVAYYLGESDLKKSLKYILDIQDEVRYQAAALENLALFHVYNIHGDDYAPSIEACRSLEQMALEVACFRGLSAGFINSGTPDKEYVRALDFCASELLVESESRHCYERIAQASYYRYPHEVFSRICEVIPEEYHLSTYDQNNYCALEEKTSEVL